MAKRIAGAVGTEMQFMPQPDATYQERIRQDYESLENFIKFANTA